MRVKLLSIITLSLILQPNFMMHCKSAGQKIRRDLASYDRPAHTNSIMSFILVMPISF
jgi:hypothetical protein